MHIARIAHISLKMCIRCAMCIKQCGTTLQSPQCCCDRRAPFVLNGKLKPMMEASGGADPKFIVNVSAMEVLDVDVLDGLFLLFFYSDWMLTLLMFLDLAVDAVL